MLEILKTHSILYAEDEPEIRANITEYLESYFDTVHVASDGEEALSCYNKHKPNILLLDINLPFISGLEVAQMIRKKDNHVKIIMLTAHTERDKLLLAAELKLTKYLVKPIAPKAFKQTMKLLAEELIQTDTRFIHLSEDYIWDSQTSTLNHNTNIVTLTEKEHRLIQFFLKHREICVDYDRIILLLWEDAYDLDISINSVKNQVSLLRKKLPHNMISSVYGKGYIFH